MIKTLGELCGFKNGGTPSKTVEEYYQGGTIPWISSADIKDGRVTTPRIFITPKGVKDSAVNVVKKGTVLLVTRTGVGKVVLAPFDLAFSQDITALIPNEGIHAEYLARFLKANAQKLVASARGATISGVSRQVVESLRIELPNLEEQLRIAETLDRVDAVRQKHAEVQRLAEDLVPAVFEEMFGKFKEKSAIGDCIQLIDYGTNQKAEHDSGEIPVLRMNNVTESGELDLTDIKKANFSPKELASNLLKPGDLLVNRTNSRDLVGKVGIWMESYEAVAASYFIRVRVDGKRLLPKFAHAALNRPEAKQYFRSKANGAVGQANIGMETIKALKIPMPSIAQQELFVKRLEAVRLFARKIQSRTHELNKLAESMAHTVFRA